MSREDRFPDSVSQRICPRDSPYINEASIKCLKNKNVFIDMLPGACYDTIKTFLFCEWVIVILYVLLQLLCHISALPCMKHQSFWTHVPHPFPANIQFICGLAFLRLIRMFASHIHMLIKARRPESISDIFPYDSSIVHCPEYSPAHKEHPRLQQLSRRCCISRIHCIYAVNVQKIAPFLLSVISHKEEMEHDCNAWRIIKSQYQYKQIAMDGFEDQPAPGPENFSDMQFKDAAAKESTDCFFCLISRKTALSISILPKR